MVAPVLAHIAGMPVEEMLLSVGPALVAAVSVGLVHIRSLRGKAPFEEVEPPVAEAAPTRSRVLAAGSAKDGDGEAEALGPDQGGWAASGATPEARPVGATAATSPR